MPATPVGTQSYFDQLERAARGIASPPAPPVTLGRTGLSISPVGFGGYRTHDEDAEHAEALASALSAGCNVIDTSANYGDGGSERLVGRVLKDLIGRGKLAREQVVVISKAGYVQGENLRLARERKARGLAFPEMTEFSGDCWHCISPEFLKDQITRSLARLGLDRIDVLLLHNPEYFLKSDGARTEAEAVGRSAHEEYYRRIEQAFRHLETEASAGRIGWYGISSNTFPEPREARDFTSLEVVSEIAERISPEHRFAAVQFPMNLFEPAAALEENNAGRTLIEFARAKGLATLVNRPLNAFTGHELVRLADFPSHPRRDIAGEFKSAMTAATALEAQYPGREIAPARDIAWGHIIRENFPKLADIDTWRGFLRHRIEPKLEAALQALSGEGGDPTVREWADRYRAASSALFEAVTAYLEEQASVVSDKIAGQLDHLCPALADSPTLSQKVIRLYRSVPGIDCILIGMRQNRYVRDALALKPPVDWESARRTFIEFDREVIFK